MEAILKNAEVVVEDEVDFDKINVGCTVKVYDITFDEEIEFKLVGSTEANSLEGKISNESPVGHALIGKTIGDVVEVDTDAGIMKYKVLDITRKRINNQKNRRSKEVAEQKNTQDTNQLLKVRREKALQTERILQANGNP